MKIFKKFLLILTIFATLFTTILLSSCKKQDNYFNYLTECRSDIFLGEKNGLKLKATYGFILKEKSVEKAKHYQLKFTLFGNIKDFSTYSLVFNYKGLEYKSNFSLDALSNTLYCQFDINDFAEKTFSVEVVLTSIREQIELSSIVPKNTLPPTEALNILWKNQPELMNSFIKDGVFNGELILRVIVKENAPYYYIGIKQREKLIAFLLDGFTGKELAVRNIYY